MKVVSASNDIRWTDVLTAVGTLLLAVIALLTIVITVLLARRDRRLSERRLEDERASAEEAAVAARLLSDAALAAERLAADVRLRDERNHAEAVRLKERQAKFASHLLHRIADLQPCLDLVPGIKLHQPADVRGPDTARNTCRMMIESLRRSTYTDAALLGDDIARLRYRTLVRLVLSAAQAEDTNEEYLSRTSGDLRNYSYYVTHSLMQLIEGSPIVNSGVHEYPNLWRVTDASLWNPSHTPAEWATYAETDPSHPQFRRIEAAGL